MASPVTVLSSLVDHAAGIGIPIFGARPFLDYTEYVEALKFIVHRMLNAL